MADLHENKLLVAFVERVTFWTFEAFLLDLSFLAFLCIVQSKHSDLAHQEHIHKTLPFFHTRKYIHRDRIYVRKHGEYKYTNNFIFYTILRSNAPYLVLNIFICSTFQKISVENSTITKSCWIMQWCSPFLLMWIINK